MKAVVLANGSITVEELPDLEPGPGQVLVEPIACGICGSDLHTVDHAHELIDGARAAGQDTSVLFDPDLPLVMGHEVSCRVLATGSGVTGIAEGSEHAVMPWLDTPEGLAIPGFNNTYPGGFSSQMLLSPYGLVPITNGLDPFVAALAEPMAVGLHAVNESSMKPGRAAIVIGAGPVGLAIIATLATRGTEIIIASDYSPKRRELAALMGATVVVDPAQQDPFDAWRAADATSNQVLVDQDTTPIIYEAVGAPGMIDRMMAGAPTRSEILVAGVCLPPDTFRPTLGIYKHLSIKFALGWSPDEFAEALHSLAEGSIDGAAMITGQVGIDGTPQAFADLSNPDEHVKILVRPDL